MKKVVNYEADQIALGAELTLYNFDFTSNGRQILPGGEQIADDEPGNVMGGYALDPAVASGILQKTDAEIEENLNFRCHLIKPNHPARARGYVIMLHGFNEKHWDKYLPWAAYLARRSGKAVILFPIAFHMNRAPLVWSDTRKMFKLSRKRQQFFPGIIDASLSNVAISTRLHHKPQRFIWSGLQSYRDILSLVEQIKAGQNAHISPDASVDFWTYSIGTFLGQIVLMSNERNFFSDSRLLTFCGGPTFNRLSPVSKFILDSESDVSLYSYLVEHLESHLKRSESLQSHLNAPRQEGMLLRCMLNYRVGLKLRESRLRQCSRQIYAIALEKDQVVPPYEVINTLQGSRGDIGVRVDILDLPYAYRHEDPFPATGRIAGQVDEHFTRIFDKFCDFLV